MFTDKEFIISRLPLRSYLKHPDEDLMETIRYICGSHSHRDLTENIDFRIVEVRMDEISRDIEQKEKGLKQLLVVIISSTW